MKYIKLYENFDKYSIDSILGKILEFGIDSLDFYEKQILKKPELQKKLSYEYAISISEVKELIGKFNIDIDNIHVDEMIYLNGEIVVGDYDEKLFDDISNYEYNSIQLTRYKSITVDRDGYKFFEYTDEVIENLTVSLIGFHIYKSRFEIVLYNIGDDEIIEKSNYTNEFKISENELNKIIILVNKFIDDNDVCEYLSNRVKEVNFVK